MLRQLTRVDYFMIVDDTGKTREYFCACRKELPPSLQTIDAATLRASQNENFMTLVDGHPYILSSVAIKNSMGTAYLLLASEINDTLLASMHPPYQTGNQILALVTGYTPTILVSSDTTLVPPGKTVDELTGDYMYLGAKIFNSEYADLLVTYAHLLPKEELKILAAPVLQRERMQLILVAALFTLFFVSIMLWISHRIAVITREITTFSRESLGGAVSVDTKGNELVVLRNHFRLLADEIRSMNRQQALLLQTVVDAIPAPLFYKDDKGIYQGCNQAFADYLGRDRKDIIQHTVYDIAPKELADTYYAADQQLMVVGGKQVYETKVRFADNKEHDIMFHKATFADETGKIMGLVGVMLDITERNQAESARKRMESELVQAQKMESIGTLAGGIAHDFNNILTAILGYTELALLEAGEEGSLQSHLKIVLKSGNRAKALVQQILTFSRQAEHEKKPISMVPIVKEALKMLRASVPSTIEFQQNIQADCGPINGDPVQIHQIVMNLCTNAYHAMRKNGGILAVSLTSMPLTKKDAALQPEFHPGRWLCLEIRDSGVGMDEAILGRIFEPYFTTKGKGEGTGLGLAVVHGIVQEHNGMIDVYSEVGVGTTFKLYFPELQQEDADGLEIDQKQLQIGSGRILLVDDEQSILGMLSGLLSAAGYEVTSCTDPQAALSSFTKDLNRYDILITDMTMPGMTGYDLARHVLRLRPELPVILCTGYSELISKEDTIQAGIQRYIMKPVSGHRLAAMVYELLHRKNEEQLH